MTVLGKLYRFLVQALCIPIFLSDFFNPSTGKEYGVGFWTKLRVTFKMIRNNMRIVSGSTFIEHIAMATAILNIPKKLEGVVVECGSYKGVSAANLSLICVLCNRTLEIFDSFEGLPKPQVRDEAHLVLSSKELHTYTEGSWCGSLEEVQSNIKHYGKIEVCHFNKGFFDTTLPFFDKKCVLVWLDVDLRSSLETCVQYLWPLLQDGCPLFTHEAGHLEIASFFFSESWWQTKLNTTPPGLVGAGNGLGIKILTGSSFNSSLGYTLKNPARSQFTEVPQIGGLKLTVSAPFKIASTSSSKTLSKN